MAAPAHEPGAVVDRNLALELVRVTEAAALAASRWIGRGDKNAADGAAVEAMRKAFDTVAIAGTRSRRSRRWRSMRSRISPSPASAVASSTARRPGAPASQSAARRSPQRDVPLRWPPRMNSQR